MTYSIKLAVENIDLLRVTHEQNVDFTLLLRNAGVSVCVTNTCFFVRRAQTLRHNFPHQTLTNCVWPLMPINMTSIDQQWKMAFKTYH